MPPSQGITDHFLQIAYASPSFFLLALFVFGLFKKWWMMGYQLADAHEQCAMRVAEAKQERDEWKAVAIGGVHTTKRVVDIAANVAERVVQP